MRIEQLVKEGRIPADHWLTRAATRNEDVEIVNGRVVWKDGTWESGTWEGGIWESGTWKDGTWEGGIWESGTWEGGIWESGRWEDGTWEGGIWESGIWESGRWESGIWESGRWEDGIWESGTWEDGRWKDGTWKDGTWKDGTWEGGTWEGGWRAFGRCRWRCLYSVDQNLIQIGCEPKTPEQWREWLAGDEVFETRRDDPAFALIRRTILQGIALMEIERAENG